MSKRNSLFKKANDMLVSEGISAEKALEIVHQAFEDRNRVIGMDDTVLCKERTIICDKASIFRSEFYGKDFKRINPNGKSLISIMKC